MPPLATAAIESPLPADGVFGEDVLVDASALQDCVGDLLEPESSLLLGASPRRRLEIATGRKLARHLLARLGFPSYALLRDADRVPLWPEAVVGSISHKEDRCVVAVAPRGRHGGIGVDIERDAAVKPGLERMICVPSERIWIDAEGPAESGRRCRAVFSAKEAVYKAWFPTLREVWAFRDVEVAIDFARGEFRALLPPSAPEREVWGRIRRCDGWIVSGVELGAPPPA
jgi:4'-phosphopantetheinyl transferase EntD